MIIFKEVLTKGNWIKGIFFSLAFAFFFIFLNPKLVMRERQPRNAHYVQCKQKLEKALINSGEGANHFRGLLQTATFCKWRGLLWFSFGELELWHFNGFMLEVLPKAFIASLVCDYNFLEKVNAGRLIDLVFSVPVLTSWKTVTQAPSNLNKPWAELEPFWRIKAQYFSASDLKWRDTNAKQPFW